jgi:hypothetical protein
MVTLLFISIFIIGLLAITLYLWAARGRNSEQDFLPPPDPPRGLFGDSDRPRSLFGDKDGFDSSISPPLLPPEHDDRDRDAERLALLERARGGDQSVLKEAGLPDDPNFYNELLDQLVASADRAPKLLALVSFVTRNELPVNRKLAEAVIASWKNSPDRNSTATTLHVTALADDADLYQRAVESALGFWRQGTLPSVSAAELRALFDGEFWVLSARTRNSGAGFVLKRTLAGARRELETATRVN